jgi:non-ribosomal peptide synthetase component E (peptide arylation enzyme)
MEVAITAVMLRSRGALGAFTCHGTAVTVPEAAPVPTAFFALTRKRYVVPFVNPLTVAVSEVVTPSTKVIHVSPESDE